MSMSKQLAQERVRAQLTSSSAQSLRSEAIAEGWLMKQGHINLSASGWTRRWCVLLMHREFVAGGGRQLVWYEGPKSATAKGVLLLSDPAAFGAFRTDAATEALRNARREAAPQKSFATHHQRKKWAPIGLPHCFRVELLPDKDRFVFAADTAAMAEWWKGTIDSGGSSIAASPQPEQVPMLALKRIGLVWDTEMEIVLDADSLEIRELGQPLTSYRYDSVVKIVRRTGAEIALYAKPDHAKHPLLLSGNSKQHAQSVVAAIEDQLNKYMQQTAMPWMIERMKQKEADAAARAEERGESTQPDGAAALQQPEPEPEPEPEVRPTSLTAEQILERALGGGSARNLLPDGALSRTQSRDPKDQQSVGHAHQQQLAINPLRSTSSSIGAMDTLAEIESEFEWMPEGWATHYPAADEAPEPDSGGGMERTSTLLIGAPDPGSELKKTSTSRIGGGDLDPEPEPEMEPEPAAASVFRSVFEADSDDDDAVPEPSEETPQERPPPPSPRLGSNHTSNPHHNLTSREIAHGLVAVAVPPNADAPLPPSGSSSSSLAAAAPDVGLMAGVSIGGGGALEAGGGGDVGEQDEHYADLFLAACKAARTTCAQMLKPWKEGNDLRVTVTDFCEEIDRRCARQHRLHHRSTTLAASAPAVKICGSVGAGGGGGLETSGVSVEESKDISKILGDVAAFLEAMCAHVSSTQLPRLRESVIKSMMAHPGTLHESGIQAAIKAGIERQVGSLVYSKIQSVLLKTAGITRSNGSFHTAAENDARLATQRKLLEGKPQRFLEIDRTLISPSEWVAACDALAKVNGTTVQGKYNSPVAQLDCLVGVAEEIYDTIRVEHPTPVGHKPKVVAADEFTPIFVCVPLDLRHQLPAASFRHVVVMAECGWVSAGTWSFTPKPLICARWPSSSG